MIRAIAAVIAGFVLWSLLWLASGAAATAIWPDAVAPDQRVRDAVVLLFLIGASVVCSLASGALAAAIAGRRAWRAAPWLAGILLAVGLMVETGAWDQAPVWYHAVFLALLVPATLAGAAITAPRPAAARPA